MKFNVRGKKIGAMISVIFTIGVIYMFIGSSNVDAKTYEVSTASELKGVVDEIRTSADAENTISLQGDIVDCGGLTFNKDGSVTTILGNGHTITIKGKDCSISASNGAVVNLGDGSNKLFITRNYANDCPGAIIVEKNGVVNMMNNVLIKDVKGNNYFGGAVTIKSGSFNMKGGTIENCGIQGGSVCFGGGVAVVNGGTFNMSGGTIDKCYAKTSLPSSNKGLIPYGAGGGVFVGSGSTFNMTGGTISNCEASESGAGVAVVASKDTYFSHSSFGFLDSKFKMTGGTISNCNAAYYGGGVFVSGYYINAYGLGVPTEGAGLPENPGIFISGGKIAGNDANMGGGLFAITIDKSVPLELKNVNLANNSATGEAADIFLQSVGAVTSTDIALIKEKYKGSKPADISGVTIDGYYEDYGDSRFVDLDKSKRVLVPTEEITGTISLIAAANPTYVTVKFDANGIGENPENQSIIKDENVAEQDAKMWQEGEIYTAAIGNKYIFKGWYLDKECTRKFDFSTAVSEDITLYAKWVKYDETKDDDSDEEEPNEEIEDENKDEENVEENREASSEETKETNTVSTSTKTGDVITRYFIAIVVASIIIRIAAKSKSKRRSKH